MSTPKSSGGSFEFIYKPSEDALRKVIEIIMLKGEEQTYFDTS